MERGENDAFVSWNSDPREEEEEEEEPRSRESSINSVEGVYDVRSGEYPEEYLT